LPDLPLDDPRDNSADKKVQEQPSDHVEKATKSSELDVMLASELQEVLALPPEIRSRCDDDYQRELHFEIVIWKRKLIYWSLRENAHAISFRTRQATMTTTVKRMN